MWSFHATLVNVMYRGCCFNILAPGGVIPPPKLKEGGHKNIAQVVSDIDDPPLVRL